MSTNQAFLKLVSEVPQSAPDASDLNSVARSYKAIKAQIEALEDSLEPFKTTLETAALESPNMRLDLNGFKVVLSEASRENFSIKDARVKLGDEIVNQFIKISTYSQLRVTTKE